MLDIDTKRRIDTARDILVGKVPNPQAQVEQITIALIYKFMDDMDAESEELGGKRKFFTGAFERYGWAKIMRAGLGGQESLNLYAEGIAKIPENPGIPALFRDIFKNAYLPYRDPETLKSFLKIIGEFSYDHSERLGDAFEYLLSVLGSQGDAGQFRTPRHIIDFMVEIMAPQKTDKILDPACGTAGFLISAYKHILRTNKDAKEHNKLTPDEKGRLAKNFMGYDISPDMVRLSLVNLYLHGFADPHIHEYDTLTQEERWNEFADVILANPPFMSPKGGIKPHKRFSIQAKRSEVLFVDYMAEHLSPTGRAAIIVPEGIIFQSQTAYKQLRKLLVENSLVAVVSLPAGCFQPYSGVKTSILVLDKSIARYSDTIAFFKVENDGFGLGAQRRPIEKNDLPQVRGELTTYLQALHSKTSTENILAIASTAQIVSKDKIAAGGDYNLSGERYRESISRSSKFPWTKLGDITLGKPQYGSGASKVAYDGAVRYIRITDLTDRGELKNHDPVSPSTIEQDCFLESGDLLIARSGSVGRTYLHKETLGSHQYAGYLIRFRIESTKALPEYVFQITQSPYWNEWILTQTKTGTISNINAQQYSSFHFPLPPLEVQREIVVEIEGYQKVINGARAVLDNYRPHVPIHPDWPMVALGDIIDELESGVSVNSTNTQANEGDLGILKTSCVTSGIFQPGEHKAVVHEELARVRCPVRKNTIIISRMNTEALVGASAFVDKDYPNLFLPDRLWQTVITRPDIEVRYIQTMLASNFCRSRISAICGGTSGSMKNIAKPQLLSIMIPLPPLTTQQAIVAELEAEQALVAANRELITRFEQKIQATIARIWDKGTKEPKFTEKVESQTFAHRPPLGEVEEKAHFKRITLTTHIINESLSDPFFGDTKMEKLLYLSEYHCLQRNLDQNYYKQAAGPYDNKFTHGLFDYLERKSKWFTRIKKGNQYVFLKGAKHDQSNKDYGYFSKEEVSRINRLIGFFSGKDFKAPEVVATLHAVWNNRLILNKPVNDSLLISDFYEWDSQKSQYKEGDLLKTLEWMRNKGLVPNGWGKLIERAKASVKKRK